MSAALEAALGDKRDAVIQTIVGITNNSTIEDVRRAQRVCTRLRFEAERLQTIAGEARFWLLSTLWETDVWKTWKATKRYVERTQGNWHKYHRKQNEKWYRTHGSEARKTPEARAKLAAQRKAQRAAKKAREATS